MWPAAAPTPSSFVMLTAWRLSAAERRALLAALRGRARVWCYAPGWLDGDRPSLEAMRELTGFSMKQVRPDKATAEPTAAGRRLGWWPAGHGSPRDAAVCRGRRPARRDPGRLLRRLSRSGLAPAGRRRFGLRRTAGAHFAVGPPGARQAGVHFYTQTDCNVYANGPYLALHTSDDGPLGARHRSAGARCRSAHRQATRPRPAKSPCRSREVRPWCSTSDRKWGAFSPGTCAGCLGSTGAGAKPHGSGNASGRPSGGRFGFRWIAERRQGRVRTRK